jgi:hypothetical protein
MRPLIVRMTIVSDATNWTVTCDRHPDDRNIFTIQARGKTRVLLPGKPFQPSLTFASEAGAYPREEYPKEEEKEDL